MSCNKSTIVLIACCLSFIVITLGAYVRLSDAGLGCPDWPGCYGKILVPTESNEVNNANVSYPERPLEQGKAWKEMTHRYVAGILLLLVFFLGFHSWKERNQNPFVFRLSFTLLILIIFQALLGMWTVTLLLKPIIVMAHLLGGMTVFLLLSWLYWSTTSIKEYSATSKSLSIFSLVAITVLYLQILLGGWTSANYAALICPELPICRGDGFPDMDFKQGFTFWTGLGKNYEFGLLDAEARTAIHVVHRAGAVITFIVVSLLALMAMTTSNRVVRAGGIAALILLCCQVSLGILNITLNLPIHIAVAHNGVAALLLISVGTILYHSFRYLDRKT